MPRAKIPLYITFTAAIAGNSVSRAERPSEIVFIEQNNSSVDALQQGQASYVYITTLNNIIHTIQHTVICTMRTLICFQSDRHTAF